jgi:nucleoside-diphosphate-sugar epimerase
MPAATIFGGTGQIGLAVGAALAADGWAVTLVSRNPPPIEGPWRHMQADRSDAAALKSAVAGGADLLLDCVAFDAAHADQLLSLQADVGRLAVVSSASVYCDAAGRTLDEAGETGFPNFGGPIHEDHPTVAPGPETYSTSKIALERRLLEGARCPVTVLRPCAIHGPHSKHLREWWFVKRLLDGRARIPLAFGGRSQFQTTSVVAIADAVRFAVVTDTSQILNVSDGDAPTVAEIGWAVMGAMGRDAELVGLPDAPYPDDLGGTPWSVARPMVIASAVPNAVTYAEAVRPAIAWVVAATRERDWREVLPVVARYPGAMFDYAMDDRALDLDGAKPLAA